MTRIVHVSSGNVFGNTHGKVVDETYDRDESEGFLSVHDETKYRAHRLAEEHMAKGAPVLIAIPGGVYGPGDPSALGKYLELFLSGRMRMMMFPETGLNLAHVDDIADGFLLIHDKEGIGESYALGGEIATNRGLIEALGRIVGRKPPRQSMPVGLVKLSIPLGPVIGKLMNQGPNLRELISTADGVTFWFSDGKARRELGYTPRDLETGLRQTFGPAA